MIKVNIPHPVLNDKLFPILSLTIDQGLYVPIYHHVTIPLDIIPNVHISMVPAKCLGGLLESINANLVGELYMVFCDDGYTL
ncbi:MAG: hypothetical protein WCP92_08425 [bacterium]